MPIREYECKNCGKFEEIHFHVNDILTTCPKCGKEIQLIISTCNHKFNGPGFYVNDYKTTKVKKNEDK